MKSKLRCHWVLLAVLGLAAGSSAQESETPAPLQIDLPPVEQLDFKAMSSILAPLERDQTETALQQARLFIDRAAEAGRLEDLAGLYFQLGHVQRRAGQPFAAALSFLRVVVHFPDHTVTVHAMERAGHALYAAGMPDPAIKLWRRAAARAEDAAMKDRLESAIDAASAANSP